MLTYTKTSPLIAITHATNTMKPNTIKHVAHARDDDPRLNQKRWTSDACWGGQHWLEVQC